MCVYVAFNRQRAHLVEMELSPGEGSMDHEETFETNSIPNCRKFAEKQTLKAEKWKKRKVQNV